jgi:hypothetical protein
MARTARLTTLIVCLCLGLSLSLPTDAVAGAQRTAAKSKSVKKRPSAPQRRAVAPKRAAPKKDTKLAVDPELKFREAMALCYDGSYRLAAPLFKELAEQSSSPDLNYWWARCAHHAGQLAVAIEKYQAALARDSAYPRARADLAQAYFDKGDRAAAEAELARFQAETQAPAAAQPGAPAVAPTAALLAPAPRDDSRLRTYLRASITPEYDTNVNAGPNDPDITLPGGRGQFQNGAIEGFLLRSNVFGDAYYDFGDRDGFGWRSNLIFLTNKYLDDDTEDFDFTQIDARTALEYAVTDYRARLPFGYIHRRFVGDSLSHAFYLAPMFEYYVSKSLALNLGYRYENEDFNENFSPTTDRQNHTTGSGTFGARYSFDGLGAKQWVSLGMGYSLRNARESRFSFEDWSIASAYSARWDTGTELYADLRYLDRAYDNANPLFPDDGDRADNRYTATLALTQSFAKHFFVSASYTYIRNQSNTPIFDYEKMLGGVTFGVKFDL